MKNKKGVTIGRILLYILFISLLGFFIYIIACTFKAIKDKQPTSTNTHEVIKKAYNNPSDRSACDYINDAYINFYRSSSLAPDVSGGIFDLQQTGGFADSYLVGSSPLFYTGFTNSSIYTYSLNGQTYQGGYNVARINLNKDDNVLHVSNDIKDFYNIVDDVTLTYQGIDSQVSLFSSFNGIRSAAIIYECNIPISLFNLDYSGHGVNWGFDWYFQGNGSSTIFKGGAPSGNLNNRFEYTTLPSGLLSSSNYITKIIIPIWQDRTTNERGYYMPTGNYNYNKDWQLCITDNTFVIDFTFDIFVSTDDYSLGYNDGYNEGLLNADSSLRDLNESLINQVSSLDSQIDNLNSRVSQQSTIISSLQEQINTSNNNFKGLFFTMADIPFKTVSNALGFEFWGINLFKFFVGIITALGIVWLIKRIL